MRCKNRFVGGSAGEYKSHGSKGAEPQRASSRPSSGTQLRIRRAAQLLTPIVGKSAAGSRLRIDPPPHAHRPEVSCGSTRLLTPIVEKSAAESRRASSRRTSRRCRTSTCESLPTRCGPGPRRTGSYPKSSVHSMRQRQRRCRPCREVSCGSDAWRSSSRAPSSAGHRLGVPSRCHCCSTAHRPSDASPHSDGS